MNLLIVAITAAVVLQTVNSLSTGKYGPSAGYNRMKLMRKLDSAGMEPGMPPSEGPMGGMETMPVMPAEAQADVPVEESPPVVTMTDAELMELATRNVAHRAQLKSRLFAKSAACDRGFGASTRDREEIAAIVAKLTALTPIKIPTRGLFPYRATEGDEAHSTVVAPVEGVWQMVYTTAFDVLSLAASPFTLLQGVYQVISADGESINVIDLAPRIQAILPVQLQSEKGLTSTFRLKVSTAAKARTDTRIGLTFKKVAGSTAKFLNFDVSKFPKFGVSFPTSTKIGAGADASDTDPSFFDVLYLDDDCLIIDQNAPGGIFVSIRSDLPKSSFM